MRHSNGNPNPKHISKKVKNLEHAVSLHFMHHNVCRLHQTLRATDNAKPTLAMAAGVANHVWKIEEIVALVEAQDSADSN
jgi:hypothetical protein